ncbi:hypothetical protein DMP06_03840 [Slackia equolifaciens]|uniref:Leucine-rich repeat domain-containing protein n=1 Tax=Slackia equolifaciens TaxID=498718 RepID=A0A3N0B116_9ACTN|nr:hypothetical protein [Slackia equolifaciens]RNL40813.1 hypothetical protein DMP06_03840 [Slackia equolifaciens]
MTTITQGMDGRSVGLARPCVRFGMAMAAALAFVACLMALAPRAAYAAVGDTFEAEGLVYEIVTQDDEAHIYQAQVAGYVPELAGPPQDTGEYHLGTEVSAPIGNQYYLFGVVGVNPDAFDGFDGELVADASAFALYADAFASLPEAATFALYVDLPLKVTSGLSFTVTDGGSAGTQVSLPDGRVCNAFRLGTCLERGVNAVVENGTGSDLSVLYRSAFSLSDEWRECVLASGQRIDEAWIQPFLTEFSYAVNGGSSVSVAAEEDTQTDFTVELPAGTPLDAQVTVDLSAFPGIAMGLVESSWENNAATVALENGEATVQGVLQPAGGGIEELGSFSVRFTVAESAEAASVWVGGVRHDAPFEEDGVKLTYENGTPTLTLDGASIDQAGGAGSTKYAIYTAGNLRIQIQGEPSTITVDDASQVAGAIYAGGALDIVGSVPPDGSSLSITYVRHAVADKEAVSVVRAQSATIQANLSIALSSAEDAANDAPFTTAIRCDDNIAVQGRGNAVTLTATDDVAGRAYYGLDSQHGSVAVFDAALSAQGAFSSAVDAWEGDINVEGRSSVVVDAQNAASFGAVFAPNGAINVDLTGGSSSFGVNAARPDDADPSLLAPAAVLAKEIAMADGLFTVKPAGAQVATLSEPLMGFGDLQTVAAAENLEAPAASVRTVFALEGQRMGDVFPVDSFATVVWQQALGREDAYDANHVVSAGDADAIAECQMLRCRDVPAADYAKSGMEHLTGLKNVIITLSDQGDALLKLPAMSLDGLLVGARDGVQSVTVESPSLAAGTVIFDNDALTGSSASVASLSFAGSMSFGSLDVAELRSLESLAFGEGVDIADLVVSNCGLLNSVDVSHLAGLEELSLSALGEGFTQLDLSSNTQLKSLSLSLLSSGFTQLDVSGLTQLESLTLGGGGFEALDLSRQAALRDLRIDGAGALASLDLSAQHALSSVWVDGAGNLESLTFAGDAPLTEIYVSGTGLTQLEIPQSAVLTSLSVGDNQLSELVIPEGSRQTLKSLIAYGNKLKSLDLGGMNLDGCLLVAAGGGDLRPQTPVFEGAEQKDESVVVDLSSIADGLMGLYPGAGAYDEATHAVTFSNADDAARGFMYSYDTGATVADGGDEAGILVVEASVDVKPYEEPDTPGGNPGQGGGQTGEGEGSQGGQGGSDEGSDSGGQGSGSTANASGSDSSQAHEFSRTNDLTGAVVPIAIGVVAVAAVVLVVAIIALRRTRR